MFEALGFSAGAAKSKKSKSTELTGSYTTHPTSLPQKKTDQSFFRPYSGDGESGGKYRIP